MYSVSFNCISTVPGWPCSRRGPPHTNHCLSWDCSNSASPGELTVLGTRLRVGLHGSLHAWERQRNPGFVMFKQAGDQGYCPGPVCRMWLFGITWWMMAGARVAVVDSESVEWIIGRVQKQMTWEKAMSSSRSLLKAFVQVDLVGRFEAGNEYIQASWCAKHGIFQIVTFHCSLRIFRNIPHRLQINFIHFFFHLAAMWDTWMQNVREEEQSEHPLKRVKAMETENMIRKAGSGCL